MTGPDELRKVADSLLTGGSNYGPLRDRLYVFADAWGAEIHMHALTDECYLDEIEKHGRALNDNERLRERLEEAEKACRMLAGTLSTFGRYSTMHPDEVLAEFAALAGKEKDHE